MRSYAAAMARTSSRLGREPLVSDGGMGSLLQTAVVRARCAEEANLIAPEQVVVMSITERHAAYAQTVKENLTKQGFRASADLRNEKISYKIREHSLQKLPYQLVVGDKEMQAETVAVRTRSGEDLGTMSLDAFTARLRNEALAR